MLRRRMCGYRQQRLGFQAMGLDGDSGRRPAQTGGHLCKGNTDSHHRKIGYKAAVSASMNSRGVSACSNTERVASSLASRASVPTQIK
jgi:hypothetical protein